MTAAELETPPGWADMVSARHLGIVLVLAGATGVYATNQYVTSSLLPTVLADIGGERYYAWTSTAFLVAAVFAALLISRVLHRFGTRNAMLAALAIFGVGSLVCSLSTSVWMLLAGRAVQGFGGGLMSGLSMASMRLVLPERLWARMLTVISAMFAFGNVAGPGLGGAFAQIHEWRLGFAVMVVLAAAIGVTTTRAMPRSRTVERVEPLPAASLALVTAGTASVSLAGIVDKGWPTAVTIVAGVALMVAFVAHERSASFRILPALTFVRTSPIRWYYLGLAGLTTGLTAETFVPLFGQRLGGLTPLAAGFLGAALSVGWSVAQVASGGLQSARAGRGLRITAPLVVALGLALTALLQRADASTGDILLWVGSLFIAGAGIGLGYARFAFPVMASTRDDVEGTKAAAAINIVQVIATAFGSAVGGVLVNIGAPNDVHSARLLYGGIAALAALGSLAALRCRQPDHG